MLSAALHQQEHCVISALTAFSLEKDQTRPSLLYWFTYYKNLHFWSLLLPKDSSQLTIIYPEPMP